MSDRDLDIVEQIIRIWIEGIHDADVRRAATERAREAGVLEL